MRVGGIVLCGGRSSRMGRPKAWLPVGGEPMLARVVRTVGEAVGPVVVVAAPGQGVPPLPGSVEVVRDEVEGSGPLGGLAAGLAALGDSCDAAYLSSCDVPLLKAEFVRRVVGLLGGDPPPGSVPLPKGGGSRGTPSVSPSSLPFSPSLKGGGRGVGSAETSPLAAVPRLGGRLHPLAAAFRAGALPQVRERLAAGRLRLTDLFDAVPTRVIEADELADADPEFHSLRNVNTPEEYEVALRLLGGAG